VNSSSELETGDGGTLATACEHAVACQDPSTASQERGGASLATSAIMYLLPSPQGPGSPTAPRLLACVRLEYPGCALTMVPRRSSWPGSEPYLS
jgi:hypothetical protein